MSKPRSPLSFGVAGLLKENATIYYASDYKSRSMGRLSDLMSAKLREVNADELRVRAVLLFGLYESYAAVGKGFEVTTDAPVVQLEVGVDDESVAVGISFHVDFSIVDVPGLRDKIKSGLGLNPFEKLLGQVQQHCNQVVIRFEKEEKRLEVVALMDRLVGATQRDIEVYEIDPHAESFLEVEQYVEVGDLNYIDLTQEAATPQGLAQRLKTIQSQEDHDDALLEEILKGNPEPSSANGEAIVVKGKSETKSEQSAVTKVAGAQQSDNQETFEKRFEGEQNQGEGITKVAGAQGVDHFKPDGEQIWPFQGIEDAATSESHPEESKKVIAAAAPLESQDEPIVIPTDLNPEETLQKINQIATATSENIQRQSLPEGVTNTPDEKRFKNWSDGLVKEITRERAQLHELTKNASKQVRQREMEFRNQERSLKTEIKHKDEQLRQKTGMLDKKIEQIVNLTLALEKMKSSGNGENETKLKSKLEMSQKLMEMKTEENKAMMRKMKDLENRLMMAQSKSSNPGPSTEMTAKLAATERKVEELKRINQRLVASMNQPKEKVDSQEVMDLRRKLEMMDRQYNESKKGLEKQAFRMRELQESERKLQSDLQRTIDENRKLRQNQKNEAA